MLDEDTSYCMNCLMKGRIVKTHKDVLNKDICPNCTSYGYYWSHIGTRCELVEITSWNRVTIVPTWKRRFLQFWWWLCGS